MAPSLRDPAAALRGNQIICIALILGQVMFGLVIAFVHSWGEWNAAPDPELAGIIRIVGVAFGMVSVPAAVFLRRTVWRKGRDLFDDTVLQSYFAGNLAFFAILEGAGLLNLTFWLITAEPIPYVVVTAVLIVFGLVNLPRQPTA